MCGVLGILTFFGEPFWFGDFFFILKQHYLLFGDTTYVFFLLFPLLLLRSLFRPSTAGGATDCFLGKAATEGGGREEAQFMSMLCRGGLQVLPGKEEEEG